MKPKNISQIQMIAEYDGDIRSLIDTKYDGVLPILATRNVVLFPGVITPILIGREQSLNLINEMNKDPKNVFGLFCQENTDVENPGIDDIYPTGVYAKLVKIIDMPVANGQKTAIIQALGRCNLKELKLSKPFLFGKVEAFPEQLPEHTHDSSDVYNTAINSLRSHMEEYVSKNDEYPNESLLAIRNIEDDVLLVNFIASNLPISNDEKIVLLQTETVEERLYSLLNILSREIQFMDLKLQIQNKTHQDIDEQQREYFLHQQMRNIREEL